MDLTPGMKRWGIVGAAALVFVGGAYALTGQVEERTLGGSEKIAFDGVFAPGDTRQTSLEGLSARLEHALERLERMELRERDRQRVHTTKLENRLAQLRSELLTADEQTRAGLLREIARLEALAERDVTQSPAGRLPFEDLEAAPSDAPAEAPVEAPVKEATPEPAVTADPVPTPEPAIYTSRPVDRDRAPETKEAMVARVFGSGAAATPAIVPNAAGPRAQGGGTRRGQIRTIRAAAPEEGGAGGVPGGTPVQLPAGSILTGVLLNGLDAPAGSQSARDPLPVLVRIKHDAILPSLFSADLAECFVLLAVHGELSSERAMMRGEELSCIMQDGTVVQHKLAAYAIGEDGRVGLRGRIVSKQGAMLGNAIIVGALKAASDAVSRGTDIAIGAGTAGLGGGGGGTGLTSSVSVGAGDALDRIAEWYLARADELFPVVEIDPGRRIDLVLTTGMTFRVEIE